MITFNQQSLFDSGPAQLHVAGLTLRHAVQPSPHADGTTLIAQGRDARPLTQTGTLLADAPRQLTALADAIELCVDGVGRTLVDDTGRSWDHVVMLRFVPGPIVGLGPRFRVDYTIDYLQVNL